MHALYGVVIYTVLLIPAWIVLNKALKSWKQGSDLEDEADIGDDALSSWGRRRPRRGVTRRDNSSSFPPGPRRWHWSLLGNILDMPSSHEHLTFSKWKEVYGDVVGLKVLGKSMIILNSREAVTDVLDTRGSINASRPSMTVMGKWGGFDCTLPFIGYTEEMHRQRRMINYCLNPSGTKDYHDDMRKEALVLAKKLLHKPEEHSEHIKRMAGAVILKVAYGHNTAYEKDPLIDLAEDLNSSLVELAALGAHPVDLFPILSYLPKRLFGRNFAAGVDRMNRSLSNMLRIPYETVRKSIDSQTAIPSMALSLTNQYRLSDGQIANERSIQCSLVVSYVAGTDTTSSVFETFLLAMMKFPDAQRRGQAAVDKLLHGERLPLHSDRPFLPYVEAVLIETLRWQPVAPLGLPHQSTEDMNYKGHFIPSGSMIFSNIWQCSKDESVFPESSEFRPERYTDGNKLYDNVIDPRNFGFGFGRRVCPGRHLAEASLWITIATLLSIFDISKDLDESGNEIEPDMVYMSAAAVYHPKPFRCRFTLRSQEKSDLLMEALERL